MSIALALTFAGMMVGGGATFVAAQSAEDPSSVVLVFDVSDSILGSDDGTNVEFAAALEDIADRVEVIAGDLTAGNATVSFVAFARRAIPYPADCQRLVLHGDAAAVTRFEDCLRRTAAEYRAGPKAPVKQRIKTAATDHVAALDEAAKLLPDDSSRSAVIFFTDGGHNPPGTDRDHEDVVAAVTPAFAGRTPLAILPVGLGTGAGAFETELRAIYDAFLRDMEPCEGRATFAWPQVVFPSGDAAGAAVAVALQEVTCSFTVAPTPAPTTAPTPSAPVVVLDIPGVPGQPRVEPMDAAARLSVDPVTSGGPVEQYVYECTGAGGHTALGTGPDPNVVVTGLVNDETFQCVAHTENRIGRSAPSIPSASFKPCAGLFACNPWAIWVAAGGGLLAILAAALVLARLYARRNRVWVTAQVDGGANQPLGWGPRLGIGLDRDDAGWYAARRPLNRAPIQARYQGNNRFLVRSAAGSRDVHQGDPVTVREGDGESHQLILRLYRRRLGEEAPNRPERAAPPMPGDASGDAVVARLDRGEPASTPEDRGPFIG